MPRWAPPTGALCCTPVNADDFVGVTPHHLYLSEDDAARLKELEAVERIAGDTHAAVAVDVGLLTTGSRTVWVRRVGSDDLEVCFEDLYDVANMTHQGLRNPRLFNGPILALDRFDEQTHTLHARRETYQRLIVQPEPVLAGIVDDVRAGVPVGVISARFHTAVATMIVDVAERIRARTGITTVGLSGGVFQNVTLTHAAATALGEKGFAVLIHRLVPPNDGGLALGQAVIAARRR